MITPGYEHQARALAEAAEEEAGAYRSMGDNGQRRATYCQGVADIMYLLLGELTAAETTAELSAILRTYNDSL